MPGTGKPTLQTIADAVGVSRMTVSLALREHSRVSEATRRRVAAEAERQGYVPNPLLGSWMARVRRGSGTASTPAMAYLTGHAREAHGATPHLRQLLEGTRKRADELGFRLKEYYAAGQTAASGWDGLADDLLADGVVGVILAPFPDAAREVRLPWDRLCSVALGHSAKRPILHTVTDEQLDNTTAALARLEDAGYRRIGLINYPHHERLHSHGHVAAYLEWQRRLPADRCIPPLRLPNARAMNRSRAWCRRHRPEIVLSPLNLAARLREHTADLAPSPQFFQLGMSEADTGTAATQGTIEPNREVGVAGVDTLAGLIYRHETGLPQTPFIIEVPGIPAKPEASPAACSS